MLQYRARYTEAGLCRRPCCIRLGSPSMWEAHYQDLRRHGRQNRPEALLGGMREARQSGRPDATIHGKIHGGRAMPKAVLCTTGKPDNAGGPL